MRKSRIAYYLKRMQARGISESEVLKDSGLDLVDLDNEGFVASPDHYRVIINNMLSLTGDPHLGLKLGAEFKVSDLGVFGYAAMSSSTLGEAREIFSKYFFYNDYFLIPTDYVVKRTWYTELREAFPLGELLPFAIEEMVVRVRNIPTMLTGQDYPVLELRLTYPPPENPDLYVDYFQCPVYFNEPRNLLKLDFKRLKDAIVMADEDMHQLCEQQIRELVDAREQTGQITGRVKHVLLRMPGEFPPMDEVAERLHVSPRTLRRQLASEDTTYQKIIDETRQDLAMQYLQHTSLTPKEISYLLGYTHVSNFRRAFKMWTGRKVSDYRSESSAAE